VRWPVEGFGFRTGPIKLNPPHDSQQIPREVFAGGFFAGKFFVGKFSPEISWLGTFFARLFFALGIFSRRRMFIAKNVSSEEVSGEECF
jgi:hypothetical protein